MQKLVRGKENKIMQKMRGVKELGKVGKSLTVFWGKFVVDD